MKPTPAEHLLRVPGDGRGGTAGQRLGHGGGGRRGHLPGRGQGSIGLLEGDECVSQSVADGLEVGDGPAELHAVEGVVTGQRQHGPAGTDQLVGDGQTPDGNGRLPGTGGIGGIGGVGGIGRPACPGRARPAADDLHPSEPGVEAGQPAGRRARRPRPRAPRGRLKRR